LFPFHFLIGYSQCPNKSLIDKAALMRIGTVSLTSNTRRFIEDKSVKFFERYWSENNRFDGFCS
ncbi:MAG: hypothetical protein ACTTH9_08890, partial [Porphyromonas gingivalis]